MRRNPIIPRLILVFPCMMMILMPWAANLEIKYNNLAVVDLDHSALSRRLVEKVASTDYFNLVENAPDYGRALESVERGEADVILEIPRDFAKSLGTGRRGTSDFGQFHQWDQGRTGQFLPFYGGKRFREPGIGRHGYGPFVRT